MRTPGFFNGISEKICMMRRDTKTIQFNCDELIKPEFK